jgi:hypothetical protein
MSKAKPRRRHGRKYEEPRRSRTQAAPSHSESAHQASRTTARQRRTKATEVAKRRHRVAPTLAGNPRTRARSLRKGARQVGSGERRYKKKVPLVEVPR